MSNPSRRSSSKNPEMVSDSSSGTRTYGYDSRKEESSYNIPGHMLGHRDNNKSGTQTSDKCLYDSGRTDSGFLSGAITSEQSISSSDDLSSSNVLSGPITSEKISTNYTDSGFLDEASDSMRIDSGAIDCMSSKLSELNLKKSHLNNLNAPKTISSTPVEVKSTNIPASPSKQVPAQKQQQQQVATLLDYQYQYFVQDEEGDTQLHLAILQGFIEVVYGLIRMAPEPCWLDVPNDRRQTPMHLAVLTAQAPIVRALLVAGASPEARDRDGNTPLHLASTHGSVECARALLQPISVPETMAAGLRYNPTAFASTVTACIIDEPNYDGQLCIHLAAAGGHVEVLRHLLWSGADINGREGKQGRTALHVAAERGRRRVSLLLLQEFGKNIDLSAVTFAGYSAYQLAKYGDPALARELASLNAAYDFSSSEESDSEDDTVDEMFGHLPTEGFFRHAIVA